ncbi:hypothetical protein NL676_013407 [Syzygium grande]|nr:hypothetical protein NL676_013407 [Syzygium grande]
MLLPIRHSSALVSRGISNSRVGNPSANTRKIVEKKRNLKPEDPSEEDRRPRVLEEESLGGNSKTLMIACVSHAKQMLRRY